MTSLKPFRIAGFENVDAIFFPITPIANRTSRSSMGRQSRYGSTEGAALAFLTDGVHNGAANDEVWFATSPQPPFAPAFPLPSSLPARPEARLLWAVSFQGPQRLLSL